MEGRDRAHAFDLVDTAAGLHDRFAEKRLGRSVSEQEQPPGRDQADVATRDLCIIPAVAFIRSLPTQLPVYPRNVTRSIHVHCNKIFSGIKRFPVDSVNRLGTMSSVTRTQPPT